MKLEIKQLIVLTMLQFLLAMVFLVFGLTIGYLLGFWLGYTEGYNQAYFEYVEQVGYTINDYLLAPYY